MGRTNQADTPPQSAVPSLITSTETASPAPKRQRREPVSADGGETGTVQPAEESTRHLTLEATTTVTAPAGTTIDMEAEIEQAKQLVKNLKRELRLRTAAGEDLEDQGIELAPESRGTKRGKNTDEGVVISSGVGKDRLVRKNKRIVSNPVVEGAKKVAWGALIFGLGVGAAT